MNKWNSKWLVIKSSCFTVFGQTTLKHYLIAMAVTMFSCASLAEQKIEHYDIDVTVDNKIKLLSIKAKIRLNKAETGKLSVLLHPRVQNLKVIVNDKAVDFKFNVNAAKKPNMYFDGQLLTVDEQYLITSNTVMLIYELPIVEVNYWRKDNLPSGFNLSNGFELGIYSSWLPFTMKTGNFSFELTIVVPQNYRVLGNGDIKQTALQKWHISSTNEQFDIPLIVSKSLQTNLINYQNLRVEVNHFGLTNDKILDLGNDIKSVLALFNAKFGTTGFKGKIQFAFVPRNKGASYSRSGFVVVAVKSEEEQFLTLAHEIAHFWWTGADTSSWHDWINESFAEYSALIAVEKRYGPEKFVERIKSYEVASVKSKPIWESDRSDDEATLRYYRKGPVIIEKLRLRLGKDSFYRFLSDLALEESRNTSTLLTILEKNSSKQDANWLEELLKN